MALTLLPHQVEHVDRMCAILGSSQYAMDLSSVGTGKTYTTTEVAARMRFGGVLVVAPLSVVPKWEHMERTYGLPLRAALTYERLRGTDRRGVTHGLLTRAVDPEGRVQYRAAPQFLGLLGADGGLLLVFDEFQHLKNNSHQNKAASALVDAVQASGGRSRTVLLSGSPIDKEEQAVNWYRLMRVLRSPVLCQYDVGTRTKTFPGMLEIEAHNRDVARAFGAAPPAMVLRRNAAECRRLAYRLFQDNILARAGHEMPPARNEHALRCYDGYFRVEDAAGFGAAVALLNTLKVKVDAKQLTVIDSQITKVMRDLELLKLPTLVRLACQKLAEDPRRKVAVCVNFTETVERLTEALRAHRPLVIAGKTVKRERVEAMRLFNAPSTERRVLVVNSAACNSGVDLDDKDGAYPRTALVSPNFNTIVLYQLSGRFMRVDTRSHAEFFVVYGKVQDADGVAESRVVKALGVKSKVMQATTPKQVAAGVPFPGSYAKHFEENQPQPQPQPRPQGLQPQPKGPKRAMTLGKAKMMMDLFGRKRAPPPVRPPVVDDTKRMRIVLTEM
jgi:hypothetical protein